MRWKEALAYVARKHPSRGLSKTCVVVKPDAKDIDDPNSRCGQPVAGMRGDWPMCAEHMELFDPANNKDS